MNLDLDGDPNGDQCYNGGIYKRHNEATAISWYRIEPQVKTKTRGWVVRMWLTIDGILIFMGHETRYQ